ncbi:MAG: DUF1552 domain-containing protein [Acidobacteria bacterium]|nr:DUF1552 domain-containing protein [Acidobacteriota bacterium]MBM3997366.1 DUF1552 domain-containing protein [Planctomycetota bacterium]
MPLQRVNRRTFLRAAGVCVGLPLLDAMLPSVFSQERREVLPRRMVLIGRPLGLHTPLLFPERAGRDYEHTRYTRILDPHREKFTVISGMSHRGYPDGHHTDVALFTGAPPEGVRLNDLRNTISLDQEVASHIGHHTRFGSLVLGGTLYSWNRRSVRVPANHWPSSVFRQLFIQGTPEEIAREVRRLRDGRSILDDLRAQAREMERSLGAADRQRLDLFLTSIREAEQRLQQDEAWVHRPKPRVNVPIPVNATGSGQLIERSRQWYDLVHLALQTDSTRVVSLSLDSQERPTIDGVTIGHHDASHHGQDPAKIEQLALIEEAELRAFRDFLTRLKDSREGSETLLDRTMVLHTSNLGNGSGHSSSNLPILLAGGGLRHAGHVAFDRRNNRPFANLFVRMIQQMGIDMRSFATSTGVISEV